MTDVALSISDFLLMYCGELTAAEIAGMCMSGKVQLRWTAYSSVKAFADSFDFSPEKWVEFYDHFGLDPHYADKIVCTMPCCENSSTSTWNITQEEIDANWQIVCDSVLIPAGEWQLVSQLEFQTVPSERQKELKKTSEPSSNLWYDKITINALNPHFTQMQETVKKKMFNMKEYAEKFIVAMDV